jgi:hypothetical protein
VRKDAWLHELLTSSSEEETEEKKARTREDKYQRFKESSRWLAEANPTGEGQVAESGVTVKPCKEIADNRDEVSTCQAVVSKEESMVDGMMKAVIFLEEKTQAIGARLEQIEARMGELGLLSLLFLGTPATQHFVGL